MVDIDIVYVVAWRAIVVELKVEEVFCSMLELPAHYKIML